jgi:hypothetical protein
MSSDTKQQAIMLSIATSDGITVPPVTMIHCSDVHSHLAKQALPRGCRPLSLPMMMCRDTAVEPPTPPESHEVRSGGLCQHTLHECMHSISMPGSNQLQMLTRHGLKDSTAITSVTAHLIPLGKPERL